MVLVTISKFLTANKMPVPFVHVINSSSLDFDPSKYSSFSSFSGNDVMIGCTLGVSFEISHPVVSVASYFTVQPHIQADKKW
jgi:hypothetical protein